MKLSGVRFYQAIQVGQKLETYLTTDKSNTHAGMDLSFFRGLVTVKTNSMAKPKLVPVTNVMWMEPDSAKDAIDA